MKTKTSIRPEKLVGFDAGTKSVTAKVGGKGPVVIPPDFEIPNPDQFN